MELSYCQTVHLLVLVRQQIILYLTYGLGDGFISNQQNPCHTYGDISTLPNPWYVTLTVTYFDSTTSLNVCQDTDSMIYSFS